MQGVRPITLAAAHGWPIRALIFPADLRAVRLGRVRAGKPAAAAADRIAMAGELIRELGEKDEEIPELIAAVAMPVGRLRADHASLAGVGVALDRPVQPRERRHGGALGRCVRGRPG